MPETDPLHPVTPRDERLLPWRAFLVAHARITRRLDEELRAEHDLTLGEYDALLALAEARDRRLRMNTLAERVILSKSGVTRLIDRLVADGLVVRDQCVTDARGAEAVLTDKGLERLRRASGPTCAASSATSSRSSTRRTSVRSGGRWWTWPSMPSRILARPWSRPRPAEP